MRPAQTLAFADHYVPTKDRERGGAGIADPEARSMVERLQKNAHRTGIVHFGIDHPQQGIMHVVVPELGMAHPGIDRAHARQRSFPMRAVCRSIDNRSGGGGVIATGMAARSAADGYPTRIGRHELDDSTCQVEASARHCSDYSQAFERAA